ncbi:hypothetical protein CSB20_11230 [bacterium DOLZORAL124_64_63]|nr:MAG: hypothetical protein CSB20_11230 [bacterium DOLZORAL124_64_63]
MTPPRPLDPSLVPASFAKVRQNQETVIRRWHEAEAGITTWESALAALAPREAEGWAATCERLQLINTFQWHEEDKSRDHGVGDEALGAIKRGIDASNRRRVQTVDSLDDIIFTGLKQGGALNQDAPLNSESPGSIIDRLSVLMLKHYHVAEAALSLEGHEAAAMGERLATLTEQIQDLGGCLDRLLREIAEGRARVKFYRQVKVYVDPVTGAIKSDL